MSHVIENLKIADSQRIIISKYPYRCWHEPENDDREIGKPPGMWYGVGTSWINWCIDEGMEDWIGKYVYEVKIDDSKIKKISTIDEFNLFQTDYQILGRFGRKNIDWDKVMKKFSGIEIAPYFWEKRLHQDSSWYYSWDVASGVIWNKNALLNRKLLSSFDEKAGHYEPLSVSI